MDLKAHPFTDLPTQFAIIGIYLGTLKVIKTIVTRPFKLSFLFFLHNTILAFGSLILLLAFIVTLYPIIRDNGLFFAICAKGGITGTLNSLYYVNYLFKLYELIDTVFLALKGKPLQFLHVYHHAMTLLLCFIELEGEATVQWVPVTINLFVHVVMYYYYAMTSIGASFWWKKYLTTLQIIQFVVDLVAIYFASYLLVGSTYFGFAQTCHGTPLAAGFGCFLITSYLVLFVNFFIQTYRSSKKKKTS